MTALLWFAFGIYSMVGAIIMGRATDLRSDERADLLVLGAVVCFLFGLLWPILLLLWGTGRVIAWINESF